MIYGQGGISIMIRKYGNLVRLKDLDDDFFIDLRYSTPDNFTGEVVYDFRECYVDESTAHRLIQAKDLLKRRGFGLKIWDAYRPVSAQRQFWNLCPDNNFVARPPDMSTIQEFKNSHMNGQCVDVTLTDPDGRNAVMPSEFDDFSPRARLDCPETHGEARRNAELLRNVMVQCGFTPYEGEWWHFYDHTVEPAPYSDYAFDE